MIGIDIIAIDRFKKFTADDFVIKGKAFSESEWRQAFSSGKPSEHLAGIFAAKEALMKVLGGDIVGRFDRITIIHELDGKPAALLDGEPIDLAVSISHDGDYAIAVTVERS
jgi:phosphopantetheine--protein transferase-like protein